jgi:EAL domain-containing protein (putative c-di-GMP-specific phosphodiesterase class I)
MPLLEARDGRSVVDVAADVAHSHLALDAVLVAELTADEQVIRAVAGDAEKFGARVGMRLPRAETLTHLLASGDLPKFSRDMLVDPGTPASLAPNESRVAAYVGVPLVYSDGTAFGVLCAVSQRADDSLDDRDVRFLATLANLLVDHLDESRDLESVRGRMQRVIDTEQITIAVQPVVSLRDGSCLGIEALSRFSATNPSDAFTAADAVGLGLELERLAVRKAWPLLDRLGDGQFLTVNLSPSSTVVLSRRAMEYDDLPLSKLVVEITEHSIITGYSTLREVLGPLRKAGLRVAVDDAGAGYASLRHVVELRPDFIKIDRDLVHGLADDHARRVAVSAFVLLALDLNAMVIAEGLERPRDLAALCDLGVDAAQGYLLGRPSAQESDVDAWLGSTNPAVPVIP